MSAFRFRGLDGTDIAGGAWLSFWAARYPSDDYPGYSELIARHESFSAEDFVQIGKWKDGAKTERQWKPGVASVAYQIWIDAARELPKCPEASQAAEFLEDWASRKYTDEFPSGTVEKRFGLSKASTILHFLSEGHFPIFDSRVRKAMSRLLTSSVPNTVNWYLDSYRPLFTSIAAACTTEDLRMVDMALFSYGERKLPF